MTRRFFVSLGMLALSLPGAALACKHKKHRKHRHDEDEDEGGEEKGEQKGEPVDPNLAEPAGPQPTEQRAVTQQKSIIPQEQKKP